MAACSMALLGAARPVGIRAAASWRKWARCGEERALALCWILRRQPAAATASRPARQGAGVQPMGCYSHTRLATGAAGREPGDEANGESRVHFSGRLTELDRKSGSTAACDQRPWTRPGGLGWLAGGGRVPGGHPGPESPRAAARMQRAHCRRRPLLKKVDWESGLVTAIGPWSIAGQAWLCKGNCKSPQNSVPRDTRRPTRGPGWERHGSSSRGPPCNAHPG